MSFGFRDGRIINFKSKLNLRACRTHGESGEDDLSSGEELQPALKENISRHEPHNIFNDDEVDSFLRWNLIETLLVNVLLLEKL